MARRHPLAADWPEVWLFTDPRLGDGLIRALDRLPRGAGVILRDYDHPERITLARRLRMLTRARGLRLFVAGDIWLVQRIGADGLHLPGHMTRAMPPGSRNVPRTAAAHNGREVRDALRAGAGRIFISPVHPTRSHPGAPVLGRLGFARLARLAQSRAAALGGITERRYRALRPLGATGWGAIDAFSKHKS